MSDQQLMLAISTRVEDIYRRWAEGDDVPPALIFRTEGFIEAACATGAVGADEVLAVMKTLYLRQFERPLLGAQQSPIRLHSAMRRAPVYPSTR